MPDQGISLFIAIILLSLALVKFQKKENEESKKYHRE
jgi:hypothetical protein